MRRIAIVLLALGIAHADKKTAPPQKPKPAAGVKVWVHAPAEDLLGLFPGKGEGYLISIEEYKKLLALARRTERARAAEPPLAARLVQGVAAGRLEKDGLLRIVANYVAVVQGAGPSEVPFPLRGIALERIEVEGGSFAGDSLRFGKPGTYSVKVTLSARLEKKGGVMRAAFSLPPAAGHTLEIDLPAGTEGEVGPIVRAFSTGSRGGRVTGYPDRNGVFTIWTRARSEVRKLDPLLGGSFDAVATLGEARTVVRTSLALEVLRAPLPFVDLLLAPGQTVRALSGKRIKTWRIERGAAKGDRLRITFVEPLEGAVAIRLETELPRGDGEVIDVPVVAVANAVRYRGTVGLAADPQVRVTSIDAEGARRLDSVPRGLVAVFEIWSNRPRLSVRAERLAGRTRAFTRALLTLNEGGKQLTVVFSYSLTGKPIFRLEPRLPAGWILRRLTLDGRPVDHRLTGEGRLVLEFPQGLKPGAHVLAASLDTDEVDWVPDQGAAILEFAGVSSGLDEETGYFVVAADRAFRVTAGTTTGLNKVGMPEVERVGIPVGKRVLYAWRFDQPQWAAGFSVLRHAPQVSVVVVNRAVPSERILSTEVTARIRIERAGVREIKVALPKSTGPLVDFSGRLIKEKRAPEKGADPEVWTIVFQRRIRGSYRLDIAFDREFDSDSWSAGIPAVAFPGATERGFVVVHSSATTAISIQRNGLREADVGELPKAPARPPLEVLAYAKQPYSLQISSQRHDPHAVVQAIALSVRIYGVLTPEGRLRCRAEYRIRNNDQPFLRFNLPGGSRLLGALVDGEPAKPLVEAGRLKLALARSKGREAPFVVAIIYESQVDPLGSDGEITVARPALDIDVLKTSYTLHLPQGYKLTGHRRDGDLVPTRLEEKRTVLGDLASLVTLVPKSQIVGGDTSAPTSGSPTLGRPVLSKELSAKSVRRPRRSSGEKEPDDKKPAAKRRPERRKAGQALKAESGKDARRAQREWKSKKKLAEKLDRARREDRYDDGLAPEEEASGDADEEEEVLEEPIPTEELADHNEVARDGLVARGGGRAPTPQPKRKPATRRRRPERALLSLDVQFLRPDNLYTLDSLAPTGVVTLAYAREETFERSYYLGAVLGAAAGLLALVLGGYRLLQLILAGVLVILGLHFAGAALLPADFARGAAAAVLVALLVAVVPRFLIGILRLIFSIRIPRRAKAAAILLALAGAAQAQEEIWVPYSGDRIEKVERVFLPADQYHRLRKLAYPKDVTRRTVITRAEYEAKLAGEELTVIARYEIVKETEQAERLALRLDGVAITHAILDDKAATLTVHNQGYLLALQGKGRYVLALILRPKLEASGERRWFRVPVRPVANATLRLTHDRTGHDVEPVALGARGGELVQIGPVGVLGATWIPKTEGFRAAAAELRAHTEMMVGVRDGYTAVAARIRYTIAGGTANRFRVRIDPGLTVRSVRCKDLAGWEITDNTLVVALSKPATQGHQLEIFGERSTAREREENVPEIVPLDVLRDAGVIALETMQELKLRVLETKGLLRGRLAQAPKKLSAAHDQGIVHSVYRFAVRPFSLRWRVYLEATRLRAETDHEVRVGRRRTWVVARLGVTVERGPGPFTLAVDLPKGGGFSVEGVQGPGLRDYWVRHNILYMARAQRQRGRVVYAITLKRTGETSEPFDIPALALRGAARETGRIRVGVADGLELSAPDAGNLLPEDIAKVPGVAGMRLRRAYSYVTMPWRLVLSTREETREVDALVVSRVVPLQDRLKVQALVNFHVRRGLVDEVSFVVPGVGSENPVVETDDLREELTERLADSVRYTLRLRTPTRGSIAVLVTYRLGYGAAVKGVEPLGVSRVQRYVAVEKVPDGAVKIGGLENLDPGDFDDLPLRQQETTAKSVAGVFVGSGGPIGLTVRVQRHSFEKIARAVVHRATAQTVVDRSGWTRTRVIYRVYNRSEQFLRLAMPDRARLYSVLVAGEGVRPLVDGSMLMIPLRKIAIGAPTFDVDVVFAYAGPRLGDEDFAVVLPRVKGFDVRRTTLSLYLPRGFQYDFDTRMEAVDEGDIVASEMTDIYQEIKDQYSVTELGNTLQAQRAFANIAALESQAKRLADKVQTLSQNDQIVEQAEMQTRAIDSLRKANSETNLRKFAPAKEKGLKRYKTDPKQQWEVNSAYIVRNKRRDNRDLESYRQKQQQAGSGGGAHRGPNGGMAPPSMRAPGDPQAPPPTAPSGGPSTNSAIGIGGGVIRPGLYFLEARRNDDEAAADRPSDKEKGGSADNKYAKDFGLEIDRAASIADRTATRLAMRGAKGRLSIRIDLELQGEVFHFQRLGDDAQVTFRAEEEGGAWIEGVLALACAAGVFLVLRRR